MRTIEILPLDGLPEVSPGDDLAELIATAGSDRVRATDVLVIAHKVVSKAEGKLVALEGVRPSPRALDWARQFHKDARVIELVLQQSRRIVKMDRGVIVAETRHGFVCANAGVDVSNVPEGMAALLPDDCDRSAAELSRRLSEKFGLGVAVIVSDTFGRPWREGLVNVALGIAGIEPLADYRGTRDGSGKSLQATIIAVADEIAGAAELVMGKANRIPVAIVRGLASGAGEGSGRDLLRARENDLFR